MHASSVWFFCGSGCRILCELALWIATYWHSFMTHQHMLHLLHSQYMHKSTVRQLGSAYCVHVLQLELQPYQYITALMRASAAHPAQGRRAAAASIPCAPARCGAAAAARRPASPPGPSGASAGGPTGPCRLRGTTAAVCSAVLAFWQNVCGSSLYQPAMGRLYYLAFNQLLCRCSTECAKNIRMPLHGCFVFYLRCILWCMYPHDAMRAWVSIVCNCTTGATSCSPQHNLEVVSISHFSFGPFCSAAQHTAHHLHGSMQVTT